MRVTIAILATSLIFTVAFAALLYTGEIAARETMTGPGATLIGYNGE